MTNTQHDGKDAPRPGLWKQSSSAPYSVWKGDTLIASCRWVDDDGRPLPVCVQSDHEARANAKLIAAAPDLLEALKQAEDILSAIDRRMPTGLIDRPTLTVIRAAISKAGA